MAGAPASHGLELASPPPAMALEALHALVAAAGYAGTHGTPAIQAALAGGSGAAAAVAAMAAGGCLPSFMVPGSVLPDIDLHAMHPAVPKRRRTGQADATGPELLLQHEEQLLMARRQSGTAADWWAGSNLQQALPSPPIAPDWQTSQPYVQMYQRIDQVGMGGGCMSVNWLLVSSTVMNASSLPHPVVLQVLASHEWTPDEQAKLQRFRYTVPGTNMGT